MEGSVQPAGGAPEPGAAPLDPGQGAPAEAPGLYSEVLEGVPSEYHDSLTERLKEMDGRATQKFQSHAERVKPYEEAGIFDADPESLTGWMNLSEAIQGALGDPTRGIAADPEAQQAVGQWWEDLGNQLGLLDGGSEGTGQEAQDLLDLTPDKLEDMIGNRITQATQPLLQRMEQQEQDKLAQEAKDEVSKQMADLRSKHPNLTDDDQEDIMGLAFLHGQDSEDPLSVGFERFQRMTSRGENALFESKLDQPAPLEGGGLPDTSAPVPNSDNAKDLALERLKQLQAT
jgi:hypothetical protein